MTDTTTQTSIDALQSIWTKHLDYGGPRRPLTELAKRQAQKHYDLLAGSDLPIHQRLANATVGQFRQRGIDLDRKVPMPIRVCGIDDGPTFMGYDDGSRWNGFASPLVDLDNLQKAVAGYLNPEFAEENGCDCHQVILKWGNRPEDKWVIPEVWVTWAKGTPDEQTWELDATYYPQLDPDEKDDATGMLWDISLGMVWDFDEELECT